MSENRTIALLYSEKDDEPIEGGDKGWVSNFYKFLTTLMYQITRENPEIKLISDTSFDSAALDNCAAVIALLSENMASNKSITQALNNHGKKLKDEGVLLADGIARFFKVLKYPFDADSHLPELEDLLTYDFYLVDPLTGDPQEFTRFFGNDAERSYWMKLVDMAYDINHVLHAKTSADEEGYETIPREKTVYLASTGVDMVIQRDIIKRELIRHGYKVLPDHSLPKEAKSLDRMIREDLDRCRLSIHLVGEDYGYKPRGSELSVVDIQNRVASDHTYQIVEKNKDLKDDEKEPFSRLVWVSPELKNVTERQKIFIEDLKSDAAALEEAEVLQITLQELKSIIREELVTGGRFKTNKREIKGFKPESEDDKSKIIYLIADRRDVESTDEMQTYLKDQGFSVVSPSYEGDLVDLRYIHQENLRRCDASIIYYGDSSEDWIRTKLQDLLKAPGFGRIKPMMAKAVYFRGTKEIDQEHYEKNNAMVLGNNGNFAPDHLKPFLTKMESK